MLVLSRKTGQKIIISENIVLSILETRGDVVKVGIEAPKDVSIYREEIFEAIKQANRQAQVSPTATAHLNDALKAFKKQSP